jgi:tRNA(Ile)-lysidine synthase
MLNKISSYIQQHKLLAPHQTIVIGLSGGPDSVFLAHLFARLREQYSLTLIAAHLDHQWRANSADDVQFCRRLAEQLQMQFVYGAAQEFVDQVKANGSQEELGRKLRRLFFKEVATKYNADAIALGHHLQDQQETFFIRMLRGTTLTGLTCMKPQEGLYIRPLLEVGKEEILHYLHEQNIAYLTDPTNESQTFLRNRIRAQVLPVLRACDSRFDANFLRMLGHLQADEALLALQAEQALAHCTVQGDLSCSQLLSLTPQLQQRVLLNWLVKNKVPFVPTEPFLQEIIRFLEGPRGGTHQIHAHWSLVKSKSQVKITLL